MCSPVRSEIWPHTNISRNDPEAQTRKVGLHHWLMQQWILCLLILCHDLTSTKVLLQLPQLVSIHLSSFWSVTVATKVVFNIVVILLVWGGWFPPPSVLTLLSQFLVGLKVWQEFYLTTKRLGLVFHFLRAPTIRIQICVFWAGVEMQKVSPWPPNPCPLDFWVHLCIIQFSKNPAEFRENPLPLNIWSYDQMLILHNSPGDIWSLWSAFS